MTEDEAARRKTLNRIGVVWPKDWTPRVIQEYLKATSDLTIPELDIAVDKVIRERTIRPAPAQIREAANPTPKETQTVGRQIELDPEYQTPGHDGIRPFIHAAIQRVHKIGGPNTATYLADLTINRTQLTETERELVETELRKC